MIELGSMDFRGGSIFIPGCLKEGSVEEVSEGKRMVQNLLLDHVE